MKTFNLLLDENAIRTMGAALMELPYKVAQPIIDDINHQLSEQQKELIEAQEE